MEAKELRISNLANVSLKSGNGRTLIKEINYTDLEKISTETGSYIYEPIPITEEWLIKAGFEKRDSEFIKGKIYESGKITVGFFKEGIETYFGPQEIFNIEHLHQLQNLYHSLTSQELTILP